MNITQTNKAILYEKLTDYENFNRTLTQSITDITNLNPDLIFRAFWQWGLTVNSCNDVQDSNLRNLCTKSGISYESLSNSISQLRRSLPNTLIIGAIPAQVISRQLVYNPKLNQSIYFPDTWNLALDPGKWGITSVTKEKFQCEFAKTHQWFPQADDCSLYNYATVSNYFPDLTNPQFQEILLSWAYSQIDAGVDGIWIDMLTRQVIFLYQITNNLNHPSIIDTTNSIDYIINSIHNYGTSKGKQIYVGTWASLTLIEKLYSIDFLTISPATSEVSSMTYDEPKWNTILNTVRDKYPTTKIIGFVDFASGVNSPLGVFSQVLTTQKQKNFITTTKNFFDSKNVIFAYPVHGGWMGNEATKLSFGTRKEFDSKAPEFPIYDHIRQLMTGYTSPSTTSSYNKVVIAAGIGLLVLYLISNK